MTVKILLEENEIWQLIVIEVDSSSDLFLIEVAEFKARFNYHTWETDFIKSFRAINICDTICHKKDVS